GCAASSTPSAPTPATTMTDPRAILALSLTALDTARTFHLTGSLTGTLTADLTGSGTDSAIDLQGTSLSADADIANQRANLQIRIPALFALTVEYIQVGPDTYSRNSLAGSTWTHTSEADIASAGPGALPTPRRIGTATPSSTLGPVLSPAPSTDLIGQITAGLDNLPNPPTLGSDATCGSKTCYSVLISVPLSADGQNPLGLPLPSSTSASVTIRLEVEQDTFYPVQTNVQIDAGTSGTFNLVLALTKFDVPVTINPPPPDQVVGASPGP
ncbi:MAG: hypothetical protein ACRDGQ_01200, partial [Candidatus Limnocylindrales bacterium]